MVDVRGLFLFSAMLLLLLAPAFVAAEPPSQITGFKLASSDDAPTIGFTAPKKQMAFKLSIGCPPQQCNFEGTARVYGIKLAEADLTILAESIAVKLFEQEVSGSSVSGSISFSEKGVYKVFATIQHKDSEVVTWTRAWNGPSGDPALETELIDGSVVVSGQPDLQGFLQANEKKIYELTYGDNWKKIYDLKNELAHWEQAHDRLVSTKSLKEGADFSESGKDPFLLKEKYVETYGKLLDATGELDKTAVVKLKKRLHLDLWREKLLYYLSEEAKFAQLKAYACAYNWYDKPIWDEGFFSGTLAGTTDKMGCRPYSTDSAVGSAGYFVYKTMFLVYMTNRLQNYDPGEDGDLKAFVNKKIAQFTGSDGLRAKWKARHDSYVKMLANDYIYVESKAGLGWRTQDSSNKEYFDYIVSANVYGDTKIGGNFWGDGASFGDHLKVTVRVPVNEQNCKTVVTMFSPAEKLEGIYATNVAALGRAGGNGEIGKKDSKLFPIFGAGFFTTDPGGHPLYINDNHHRLAYPLKIHFPEKADPETKQNLQAKIDRGQAGIFPTPPSLQGFKRLDRWCRVLLEESQLQTALQAIKHSPNPSYVLSANLDFATTPGKAAETEILQQLENEADSLRQTESANWFARRRFAVNGMQLSSPYRVDPYGFDTCSAAFGTPAFIGTATAFAALGAVSGMALPMAILGAAGDAATVYELAVALKKGGKELTSCELLVLTMGIPTSAAVGQVFKLSRNAHLPSRLKTWMQNFAARYEKYGVKLKTLPAYGKTAFKALVAWTGGNAKKVSIATGKVFHCGSKCFALQPKVMAKFADAYGSAKAKIKELQRRVLPKKEKPVSKEAPPAEEPAPARAAEEPPAAKLPSRQPAKPFDPAKLKSELIEVQKRHKAALESELGQTAGKAEGGLRGIAGRIDETAASLQKTRGWTVKPEHLAEITARVKNLAADLYAVYGERKAAAIDKLMQKITKIVAYQDTMASGQQFSDHSVFHLTENIDKAIAGGGRILAAEDKANLKITALLHDIGYVDDTVHLDQFSFKVSKSHPAYSRGTIGQMLEADLREVVGSKSVDFIKKSGMADDLSKAVGEDNADKILYAIEKHSVSEGEGGLGYSSDFFSNEKTRMAAVHALADDLAVVKVPELMQLEGMPDLMYQLAKIPEELKGGGAAGSTLTHKPEADAIRNQMKQLLKKHERDFSPEILDQFLFAIDHISHTTFKFDISPAVIHSTSFAIDGSFRATVRIKISKNFRKAISKLVDKDTADGQITKIVEDVVIRSDLNKFNSPKTGYGSTHADKTPYRKTEAGKDEIAAMQKTAIADFDYYGRAEVGSGGNKIIIEYADAGEEGTKYKSLLGQLNGIK